MIDGLNYVPLSDIGVERDENQDYQGHDLTRFGLIFVVADGMGGHAGGATASQMAVNEIKRTLRSSNQSTPDRALEHAIRQANYDIWRTSQERFDLRGMGSTVVAMLITEHVAYIAHVGDSRIYMLRGDTFLQLTKDHTMVQRMVDDGILTEEAARHHPTSHVLSRSLGGTKDVMVESGAYPIRLEPGDIFLLCSDGLTGPVEDHEIGQVLRDNELHEAARILVDEANARGGLDNTTIAIVQIASLPVQRARVAHTPPPAPPAPPPPRATPPPAVEAEAPPLADDHEIAAEEAPDDASLPVVDLDSRGATEPTDAVKDTPDEAHEPDEADETLGAPQEPDEGSTDDAPVAIEGVADDTPIEIDGAIDDGDEPEDPTQSQVIAGLADSWDEIAQSIDQDADLEDREAPAPEPDEGADDAQPQPDDSSASTDDAPRDFESSEAQEGEDGDEPEHAGEAEAEVEEPLESEPALEEGEDVDGHAAEGEGEEIEGGGQGQSAPSDAPAHQYEDDYEDDFPGVDEFGAVPPRLIAYSAQRLSTRKPLKLLQAPASAQADAVPEPQAAPSSLNPTILMIACVAALALGLLMGFMLGHDRVPTLDKALQGANQRLIADQAAINDLKTERDKLSEDLSASERALTGLQSERDVIKDKLDELDSRHKADQELIQTLQQNLDAAGDGVAPPLP